MKQETLVLDYRTGGSAELQLGDPLDDAASFDMLDRVRAALIVEGREGALALLSRYPFALHAATNRFGDDFLAVHARVSRAAIVECRDSLNRSQSTLKLSAAELREAIAQANKEDREVRFVALSLVDSRVRGELGEYDVGDEFDRGGFATIHEARTAAGATVALKRLHTTDEEAVARLRREIQEQKRINHRAVMPVIDHDPAFRWFVMPLATENLAACWAAQRLDDARLVRVLRSAIEGLSAAHAIGLVHRDVSPRNILRLHDDEWVVADWGVVRRPPGFTTLVRTQGELGTFGFAAPELFRDAHGAGPSADVYALGRIAAWAVTRSWPEQNVPLLPEGSWRQFVRQSTEGDPSRRPQSMGNLSTLLVEVENSLSALVSQPSDPSLTARGGGVRTPDECLEFCLAHLDDREAFLDQLPAVGQNAVESWAAQRANDLSTLIATLDGHLARQSESAERDRAIWVAPLGWLRLVSVLATARRQHGLLEDVAIALLRAEVRWAHADQRTRTRVWLESLQGEAAATVARVLVRQPDAVAWLADGWSPTDADDRIDALLRPPTQ